MTALRFALLSSSVAFTLAAIACGGISDPTRGGEGRIATVSGALTGISVPSNARVALVYRTVVTNPATGPHAGVEVGSDVAVVDGKFTMNLGVPSADYFQTIEGRSFSGNSSSEPPSSGGSPTTDNPGTATPPSAGSSTSGGAAAFGLSTKLAPRDIVGGQITEPIAAALAGFIVYADTNGNGKLDLEGQYASSPDQILGGNSELILVYLKGGGTLDYEKLRDKSGILPASGFNLAWSEGRWLPLNLVELKLTSSTYLPSAVCDSYSYDSSGSSSGSGGIAPSPVPVAETGSGSAGSSSGSIGGSGYPSPTDPALSCSPDGTTFSFHPSVDCPAPTPQPVGLCSGGVYETTACAGRPGYTTSLTPGQPVPAGWPCPVSGAIDGGAADASIDGGAADGG